MVIEGRFQIISAISNAEAYPGSTQEGGTVKLTAAYNDGVGNTDWSKYTPSGTITMSVTIESAFNWYLEHVGEVIRVRMSEVPGA